MCTPIMEISFIMTILAWVNKVLLLLNRQVAVWSVLTAFSSLSRTFYIMWSNMTFIHSVRPFLMWYITIWWPFWWLNRQVAVWSVSFPMTCSSLWRTSFITWKIMTFMHSVRSFLIWYIIMMNFMLIKWTSCCMKCQFPHDMFKFVKDFLSHLEYYDIYTFRQIIFDVVHYYMTLLLIE